MSLKPNITFELCVSNYVNITSFIKIGSVISFTNFVFFKLNCFLNSRLIS